MEPIVVLPARQLKEMIERYEEVVNRLVEADKELAALKEDKYVGWDWICDYFGITKATAVDMLAEEKLFVYRQQIKRFKKSAIMNFAERNSIKVQNIPSLPHQDRLRNAVTKTRGRKTS